MYNQPKRAKRLFFDVIPRMVDDYATHLERFHDEDPEKQIENPVWHIHMGQPPQETTPVSFTLLLNLAGVCQAEEPAVIWAYLGQYAPGFRRKPPPSGAACGIRCRLLSGNGAAGQNLARARC